MELKGKSFAVVGASNNPNKYGHKVVLAIKRISNKVFPINLKETRILGLIVYKKAGDIKEKVDFLVFVVPPKVTLSVLKETNDKNGHYWFQEGSFDDKVLSYCKLNGLNFTSDKCIIVESEKIL